MNGHLTSPLYRDPIAVKNDGSQLIPAYGVMEIAGDSIYVQGKSVLKVRRPTTDYNRGRYLINGPQAIGEASSDNPYGVAYNAANNPVWAAWTGTTPAIGGTYGPTASSFNLTVGGAGFNIVGKSETTPFSRVLVMQDQPYLLQVRLNADLATGGNATADVMWSGGDNGMDVTVYDGLSYIPSGKEFVTDVQVTVGWIQAKWMLIQGPCPTTI